MAFLADLWLPILLSGVFVFFISSILHMVLPIHKGDCTKLPGEQKLLAEMRAQGLSPGEYVFPCPESMKDMASPEMIEKYNTGPVGFMAVVPNGPFAMGRNLLLWFLYSILIGVFTAYAAYLSLGKGADAMLVFRITGSIAVVAYATSAIPNSIWKGARWTSTLKFVFDGILYGLATGGTFAWLWP